MFGTGRSSDPGRPAFVEQAKVVNVRRFADNCLDLKNESANVCHGNVADTHAVPVPVTISVSLWPRFLPPTCSSTGAFLCPALSAVPNPVSLPSSLHLTRSRMWRACALRRWSACGPAGRAAVGSIGEERQVKRRHCKKRIEWR